ncbi:hypothetical protein TNCV_3652831 [Trichonephila clavipes]|nr:hypothetical protein TNCV_3652831 [Trichonephila clavipes]
MVLKQLSAVGSLLVRASDFRPEGLGSMPPNTLRVHTDLPAEIVEMEIEVVSPSIVPSGNFAELNRTVTCMVLKANDKRTSCPCHDEFHGPRSDYVRQVASENSNNNKTTFPCCSSDLTATVGSDVVQSGRPIFDYFFQHLWPYIGNNTANVVFQMVKRLWLIRIDQ